MSEGGLSSLLKKRVEYLRLLEAAVRTERSTWVWLDRVARGELVLDAASRAALVANQAAVEERLNKLQARPITRRIETRISLEGQLRGQPSDEFRERYAQLWDETYGTPAPSPMGQGSEGRAKVKGGIGRDRSDQPMPTRPTPPARRDGARKNTIRDRAAWEFKRKIDRKLQHLTTEIKEFLTTRAIRDDNSAGCTNCGRWGSPDWAYCPWCGRSYLP